LVDRFAIRWWLMLPLAAASAALLFGSWKATGGLERRVCAGALGLLLFLVLARDIRMSQRLAGLYDRYAEIPSKTKQGARDLGRDIREFFKK
jgi:hypothetical protein